MKKISFVAIIATIMACPAFADIAANNNNPTCDSATIGATSGDTALDATWTANTLNLKFMANGQQFASSTCTYGQNITIPTGTPTRTGYNFAGWQLRVSAPEPTRCEDITDESICESGQYEGCVWNTNVDECMVFSTSYCNISTQSWCEANDLYWNGTKCTCEPGITCEPCSTPPSDPESDVGCSSIQDEETCTEYETNGCSWSGEACISEDFRSAPDQAWCEADGNHWCKDSCQAEACE